MYYLHVFILAEDNLKTEYFPEKEKKITKIFYLESFLKGLSPGSHRPSQANTFPPKFLHLKLNIMFPHRVELF